MILIACSQQKMILNTNSEKALPTYTIHGAGCNGNISIDFSRPNVVYFWCECLYRYNNQKRNNRMGISLVFYGIIIFIFIVLLLL